VSAGTPAEQGRVPRPQTGRVRRHLFPGRNRRVHVRFTDDEYDELATAADQTGLTPTGFCAQAALDAARGRHTDRAEQAGLQALARLQAELFRIRVAVNQMPAELGRGVDASNADGHTLAALDIATAHAADSLADLDDVISRIHQRFRS